MNIPSRFKVNGHQIKIEFDNEYCNEDGIYGEYDYNTKVITMSDKMDGKRLTKKTIELTYLHELFHCIFDVVGEPELSRNEDLVEKLAQAMYQIQKSSK